MGKQKLADIDLQNIYIRVTLWLENLLKIAKDFPQVSYEGLRKAMISYTPIHRYVVAWNDIIFLETQEKVDINEIPELHKKMIMFTLSENRSNSNPMIFVKF